MAECTGLDVAAVRADIPALTGLVYLNTGTAGPLPRQVRDAMVAALDADLARGRASGRRFARIAEGFEQARALLAGLVRADEGEIALTSGTTDGIEQVLASIPWSPGDRVLTTSLEHPDVLAAVRATVRRHDLRLVLAGTSGHTPEEIGSSVIAAAEGARLIVVSHVTYGAGAVLPIERIAAAARRHGARVLVDGAQAVGALDVDVHALGADFYAFPGQKWLLGPEGTGALVVTRGAHHRPASAFGSGAKSAMLWAGLRAAVRWREEHGHERLLDAVWRGAALARRQLAGIPGIQVLTPAPHAGLVAFRLAGADPLAVATALGAQRIAARGIAEIDAVRLSCGPFTTGSELAFAVEAIERLTLDKAVTTQ
ncbi:aminotransferase class V-fold PLP-dependent enzyme [Acrocarpospora macrocephala]|uniref:Cysteine lyase n=1 Tax=Acrocarpospora macrocephala TaxID=150177 RepID=A0A5M3WJM5_9ACTN|nr:aminotransferase class V-fold PLP-dependent enzyme [Acrocarpospora macrocephala]GES07243.1 cysteine lyase [Acrocarpospora macrocephala]